MWVLGGPGFPECLGKPLRIFAVGFLSWMHLAVASQCVSTVASSDVAIQ